MMQLNCPNCGEKELINTSVEIKDPNGVLVAMFDNVCIICNTYWNKNDDKNSNI